MNRFIYYAILINIISNISSLVPRVLLAKSKEGALFSMGLGLIVALLLTYMVIRFFNKYPGKGLPELLKKSTSKWLYVPIIFYFSVIWFVAGLVTVITYIFMLVTFLSPEMSFLATTIPFLLILSYGIIMKTKKVLYTIEIVLLLFIPIGFFVFLKAYLSKQMNWDFVKLAIMNANNLPDYSAFAATIFLFTGVLNVAIFNRYFTKKQKIRLKHLIFVGLTGFFMLFTTYFLPIGFGGFDQVDNLLYPWISTTDSIRMRYGIIERLVFVFLIFFVSISFMSAVIHWHVSVQFLNSIIYFKKFKWKDKNLTPYLYALLFSITTLFIIATITATELYQYSKFFYNSLTSLYSVLLISMLLINRGVKS